MLQLVNAERSKRDIAPVPLDHNKNTLTHDDPIGDLSARIKRLVIVDQILVKILLLDLVPKKQLRQHSSCDILIPERDYGSYM
ncbi:10784_t:CDS:2 [Diversispora eburnea]|uniref:10784_t:CDS:1 n=1 Tax=Diversispora eburnea TaxID=1213867 RepID=A0A9N9FLF3_9GLOM|nr:10784_t:CDS:2 [Diversispora eburnea]